MSFPEQLAHVDTTTAERAETAPWKPHAEQRKSQISDAHRLLRSVQRNPFQLYTRREASTKAVYVDAGYWNDSMLPVLRGRIGDTAAMRVSAAIQRARKNAGIYGVRRPTTAEVITECLWDNKWFKTKADHVTRSELRDQVAGFLRRGDPIELVFPVFSRKPFSPVKNRGNSADSAELHSLARCAALAHAINTVSPTGCRLVLLADGLKYNRACKTPRSVVLNYQDTLRQWLDALGAGTVVQLRDYEDWVVGHLGKQFMDDRSIRYHERNIELAGFDAVFDPATPASGLDALERSGDELGPQLAFTFRSIVASVYYENLLEFGNVRASSTNGSDEVDRLYSHYLASLSTPLARMFSRPDMRHVSGMSQVDLCALHYELREEAWLAARRYVAISLADRDLNVLRQAVPHAIKLTIHGKPGELHFVTTSPRDPSMTAQHATGGYRIENGQAKPTFDYRLDREAAGEVPVHVTGSQPDDVGLHRLERAGQPIAYVTDPQCVIEGRLHRLLTRTEI